MLTKENIAYGILVIISLATAGQSLFKPSNLHRDPEIQPGAIFQEVTYVIKKVPDPRNDFTYVQLTGGVRTDVLKKINEELAFYGEADGRCITEDSRHNQEVSYAENDFLSISGSEEKYCQGTPHPALGEFGLNYDLRTGEQIYFSELFARFEEDKSAIQKIVLSFLTKENSNFHDGCGLEDVNGASYGYTIIEGNFSIHSLGFPHALRSCEPYPPILIPTTELAKYLKPEYLFLQNQDSTQSTNEEVDPKLIEKYGPCYGIPEGECRE